LVFFVRNFSSDLEWHTKVNAQDQTSKVKHAWMARDLGARHSCSVANETTNDQRKTRFETKKAKKFSSKSNHQVGVSSLWSFVFVHELT
jgi:hypothetical protein